MHHIICFALFIYFSLHAQSCGGIRLITAENLIKSQTSALSILPAIPPENPLEVINMMREDVKLQKLEKAFGQHRFNALSTIEQELKKNPQWLSPTPENLNAYTIQQILEPIGLQGELWLRELDRTSDMPILKWNILCHMCDKFLEACLQRRPIKEQVTFWYTMINDTHKELGIPPLKPGQ